MNRSPLFLLVLLLLVSRSAWALPAGAWLHDMGGFEAAVRGSERTLAESPHVPVWLRPEAVGLFGARTRQWAPGAGLASQRQGWELGGRMLLGDFPVFALQSGVLLGGEAGSTFLGLRASLVPDLDLYGGGPVVGARFALPSGFVVVAEVGADCFLNSGDDRYRFVLTAQVGLGFRFDLGPS